MPTVRKLTGRNAIDMGFRRIVQEALQAVFDRIVPLRDTTPETLSDYMSGLTASDYMSGAFDFTPDLTVLPLRES